MEERQVVKVDLIEDSLSHLLTLCFAKSSAFTYSIAVHLAKSAEKYDETYIGKTLLHMAAFGKNREDAARAMTLIGYIRGWKATKIFAGGKIIQDVYRSLSVLRCYIESLACNDWTAHCFMVIDDPYSQLPSQLITIITLNEIEKPNLPKKDKFIFPCAFLKQYFRFQIGHPASPENQLQAKAIEIGCDWCPRFNQHAYQKIVKS
ncbi:MAG: hypothetical protein ACYDIC_07335 [Desulfobaccales bacterium]